MGMDGHGRRDVRVASILVSYYNIGASLPGELGGGGEGKEEGGLRNTIVPTFAKS